MQSMAIKMTLHIDEARHLRAFQHAGSIMLDVPTDNRIWEDAERTALELDREGLQLPLPDIGFACCARRIGAVVLTFDGHFQAIPGIKAVPEIV